MTRVWYEEDEDGRIRVRLMIKSPAVKKYRTSHPAHRPDTPSNERTDKTRTWVSMRQWNHNQMGFFHEKSVCHNKQLVHTFSRYVMWSFMKTVLQLCCDPSKTAWTCIKVRMLGDGWQGLMEIGTHVSTR